LHSHILPVPGSVRRVRFIGRCGLALAGILALPVAIGACGSNSLILTTDASPDGRSGPESTAEGDTGENAADAPPSLAVDAAAPSRDGVPANVSTDIVSPVVGDVDAGPLPGPCGGLGHACCPADAGSAQCSVGLACSSANVCQTCGGTGELCCPAGAQSGAAGECKDAGATCTALPGMPTPMCVGCGMAGGLCCAGKTCREISTACLAMPPMGYVCRKCGGMGERCCSDHTTAPTPCGAGLKCNPSPDGDQCGL
jgi:hypothetical protein